MEICFLKSFLLTTVFLLFLLPGLQAQEETRHLRLQGYIKDLQTATFVDDADSIVTSNLIHNRLNFRWDIADHIYTRVEARNRLFYGEQVKLIPQFGKLIDVDEGYVNLSKLWVNKHSLVIHSILDRALLDYSKDKWDFTIGRQRINWGINTVWNPNDLFNAYNFLDFDYEERPGSDAMRLQYFNSPFSKTELAFMPGNNKNESVAAALYKFNRWKYDIQFIGGLYREDVVLGAGWAGNIKDAGFKGEASYFRSHEDFKNDNGTLSASLMIDYAFSNAWYGSAAMLYQSRPVSFNFTDATLSSRLTAKNLMPFRYTYFAGITKGFTPIFSGNLSVLYSPTNHTLILFPVISRSLSQNFDVDLTIQSFFSEINDRYRTAGNAVYLRMKWSF